MTRRLKESSNEQNLETTTLDDILDSLLGLSSSTRTPSPAKTSLEMETVDSSNDVACVTSRTRSYADNVIVSTNASVL